MRSPGASRGTRTVADVDALVDAVPARYRALVQLAAETGMRIGELAALRVGRIDVLRRTVAVAEAAVEVHGELIYGEPKSSAGRRVVALSRGMTNSLAAHFAAVGLTGAEPQALVFTSPAGGPLRYSTFRSLVWLPARRAAGVEWAGFHDLRRASATMLMSAGVDVRTAQHRLGHSDPRLTLGSTRRSFPRTIGKAAEALGAILSRDARAMEVVDTEGRLPRWALTSTFVEPERRIELLTCSLRVSCSAV